jgi:hypothetical protein
VIGIAGYVVLLLAAAVPGDAGRFGGFLTALVGFGFSAYLTYLELFVIDAICQWCVASAVLMTLSLAVAAPEPSSTRAVSSQRRRYSLRMEGRQKRREQLRSSARRRSRRNRTRRHASDASST